MSKGKHAHSALRHRRLTVIALVAGVAMLAAGGTAYAAVRYDDSNARQIMPGVTVAGVDVGGMNRAEAVKAVRLTARESLDSELDVEAAGESWTVTAGELGLRANVAGAVDRAIKASDSMGLFSRVYHRITNESVDKAVELGFKSDKKDIESFVADVTDTVTQEPTDAAVVVEGGDIQFRRAQTGRTLDTKAALTQMRMALERQQTQVKLPVETVKPEVAEADLGYTILVSRESNSLRVYKGFDIARTYGVATGTSEFPTPTGAFEIINKVENPTWVNPDPTGWGSGLPASIPPGPGNPLGTRALYLDAPGIRIHGTYAEDSIGTAASHGCIRMRIADSEELYPIIPIGTPVYVY
ncbi:MAG: L,D-transpeptidase/peptidoglycan binding protein [Actinomycetota bacterium]